MCTAAPGELTQLDTARERWRAPGPERGSVSPRQAQGRAIHTRQRPRLALRATQGMKRAAALYGAAALCGCGVSQLAEFLGARASLRDSASIHRHGIPEIAPAHLGLPLPSILRL